ncbi:Hypothetical predicted protein [Marmota monax]|uniref:Uncharacterized protein n=1 Tax=Marmota monax TaxID=9995 RepID=A0A5E4A152_MARMO|nr:Hypothetical predicted protein [Marmota monax]
MYLDLSGTNSFTPYHYIFLAYGQSPGARGGAGRWDPSAEPREGGSAGRSRGGQEQLPLKDSDCFQDNKHWGRARSMTESLNCLNGFHVPVLYWLVSMRAVENTSEIGVSEVRPLIN